MAITKLNSLAIPDDTIVEADLSYPLTNFSSTGIDDNATSTAITIDSSQNVGIGKAPESWGNTWTALDVSYGASLASYNSGGFPNTWIVANGYHDNTDWRAMDTDQSCAIDLLATTGTIRFLNTTTNTTAGNAFTWNETMRLDGSGNLLIGMTNDTPGLGDTDVGASFRADGASFVSRTLSDTSGSTFYVNRNTNDGNLIQFQKNGTTVGSIGVDNSIPYFLRTTGGIAIGNTALLSAGSTGAINDAASDLGGASYRWKDLYLSGGAYLGGTGSGNYLDDYEEGTWTPVANNLTLNYSGVTSSGSYVKIGKLVTATFAIQWTTANVGAGYAALNLPLLSSTDYGSGILIEVDQAPVNIDQLSMYTTASQSLIYFRRRNAGGSSAICARTDLFVGGSNRISGTITYYAS